MTSSVLYRASAEIRADSAGRTIYGLAIPYGKPAFIADGYGGGFRERFAPGAFARSIRERGAKIKLFTQHETQKLPIGRATELHEEHDGLHAGFALARVRAADEALELVSSGTVDGFSVGFVPIRDSREKDGTIVRTEAALREVSLVHSPAYAEATVAGVRSQNQPLPVAIARRRLFIALET